MRCSKLVQAEYVLVSHGGKLGFMVAGETEGTSLGLGFTKASGIGHINVRNHVLTKA